MADGNSLWQPRALGRDGGAGVHQGHCLPLLCAVIGSHRPVSERRPWLSSATPALHPRLTFSAPPPVYLSLCFPIPSLPSLSIHLYPSSVSLIHLRALCPLSLPYFLCPSTSKLLPLSHLLTFEPFTLIPSLHSLPIRLHPFLYYPPSPSSYPLLQTLSSLQSPTFVMSVLYSF